MIKRGERTYYNVTLSRDMIAQAYADNESYDSHCFLVGPPSSNLPTGFEIFDAYIEDGHLKVEYINKTPYSVYFYIECGMLKAKFMKGGKIMALVDLGNVIGPQGPQGPQGISPTFIVGDGTGGTTAGHLYADYDNPYNPNP